MSEDRREMNEIAHGRLLASKNSAESIWGWGSKAGQMRAERRARLIASGAQLKAGDRVLEVGCGTGMFTEIFTHIGAHIIAVDISPDLLEIAKRRNLPAEKAVFVEKCFEDCDFEGTFDAVVGSSVLHHLDVGQSLRRMYELLKPGARLCFAEPNMLNPQVFIERKLKFVKPLFSHISPDETAFYRWKLQKLLLNAGFQDVKITPFDWLHPSMSSFLIKYVSVMGKCLENIPVVREFSGSLIISARRTD